MKLAMLIMALLTVPVLADQNLTISMKNSFALDLNGTVTDKIDYINNRDELMEIFTAGDNFFVLPAGFNLTGKTFITKPIFVLGNQQGIYQKTVTFTYKISALNVTGAFSVPVTLNVGNITTNITTNQTNVTSNVTSQICPENCSIRITVKSLINNATYLAQKDFDLLTHAEGDFDKYTCDRRLDGEEKPLGIIVNNTDELFVIFNIPYGSHSLYVKCSANNTSNSTVINFSNPKEKTNVTQNVTNITTQSLTRADIEKIVKNILESNATQLKNKIDVLENLQDFSCLYTEQRIQEFYTNWAKLSPTAKDCLNYFIRTNTTTVQLFGLTCPFLQGDIQSAFFILAEYEKSGFAQQQCKASILKVPVQTTSGIQVQDIPQQVCFFVPQKVTQGCINKFEAFNTFKKESTDSGFAEGAMTILVVFVFIMFAWIWGASGGG